MANGTFSSGFIHRITLNIIERLCCFDFLVPCTNPVQTLYKPCANHRHASMALVMLGGHSVWLTPISRGRVSHSDSGLNTVGGVLSCPWFVNDWHSLRIMPLEAVLIWRDALCKPQSRKSGSAVLIFGALCKPCANHSHSSMALLF